MYAEVLRDLAYGQSAVQMAEDIILCPTDERVADIIFPAPLLLLQIMDLLREAHLNILYRRLAP